MKFIVDPFIGAIVGKPEFTNTFKIGDGVIQYGAFITTVINRARAARLISRSTRACPSPLGTTTSKLLILTVPAG